MNLHTNPTTSNPTSSPVGAIDPERFARLGPAEHLLQTVIRFQDHLVHHRPGIVVADPSLPMGLRWEPAVWRRENPDGSQAKDGVPGVTRRAVYQLKIVGKAQTRTRIGWLSEDNASVLDESRRTVASYRPAGIFPEAAAFLYRQIANVWRLDPEFLARWASYAFTQDHRDLKVVLAAFLIVQSDRVGAPVLENGKRLFDDVDYRAVGEAMCLGPRATKGANAASARDRSTAASVGGEGAPRPRGASDQSKGFDPKMLARIGDLLELPAIATINRELGFGRSARQAPLGRYHATVGRWLGHREQNLPLLQGLVRSGQGNLVRRLCKKSRYKPSSDVFFAKLGWKQSQAKDGRRTLAIGVAVQTESWAGMDEAAICRRISETRPDWKRITGLLVSAGHELTAAVLAAAIEAGCLGDRDLIQLTPTIEEFGLLQIGSLKARWEKALATADNQRAANVARRVKTEAVATALEGAADEALKKEVAKVMAVRSLRIYLAVDISGSMEGAIATAQECLGRFVQGFPLSSIHVVVFNTMARAVAIPHASAAGVTRAFAGLGAGGGTDYSSAVAAFGQWPPQADEDVLFWFVGDQDPDHPGVHFRAAVERLSFRPAAFALLEVRGGNRQMGWSGGRVGDMVERTARELALPCFRIDTATFADPYATPRILRDLIAATPVNVDRPVSPSRPASKTLVQQVLETPLLERPLWA